jgi:tryptophan synthase beta chain
MVASIVAANKNNTGMHGLAYQAKVLAIRADTPGNCQRTGPDENGLFGIYGGRFVAETLMPLILELEQAYKDAKADPSFQEELDSFLEHYVGRPSPLYFAERMTEHLGGAKIYFKRDELNHTGAH